MSSDNSGESSSYLNAVHNTIRTFREFGVPRTKLTAEEKALHVRILAAGDAASVTRAERNAIYRRPPPDEEDQLCRDKVGLTMAELQNKAVVDPDSLSEAEADVLAKGPQYDETDVGSIRDMLWMVLLPDDERKLSEQVRSLIHDPHKSEAYMLARVRAQAFDGVKRRRAAERRIAELEPRFGPPPRWMRDMLLAALPRWGFVVFRTAYGEGTDRAWSIFGGLYMTLAISTVLHCWRGADRVRAKHKPLYVSDPALKGADVEALRRRFSAMRKQGEIPDRIATDCFLIVDEAVLNHPVMTLQPPERPPSMTLSLRAVNPDHNGSAPVPTEGELAGYAGEISVPLPKVVDWLYYCSLVKSEDWETRYKVTKSGPPEAMDRSADYPAYRPGTEPPMPRAGDPS